MSIQTSYTPRKSEAQIKKEIKDHLEALNWLVVFLVISNKDGFHDIIAAGPNARTIWMEVKRPGKSRSKLQDFRHAQLRNKGHESIVVESLDQVKEYLQKSPAKV